MKVAITAWGPTPDSHVDERFGRAYWILIFDEATGEWEAIDNSKTRQEVFGAGVIAAEVVLGAGADVVITGEIGPKAFRILRGKGITICQNVMGTATEALSAWRAGDLPVAFNAAAPGNPQCLVMGKSRQQFAHVSVTVPLSL